MEKNVICGGELEKFLEGTLGELLLTVLKVHEDNVLQIDANTGEKLSANILLSKSIKLAKWLKQNGIQVGDSVSIISENRLEFGVVPSSSFFLGATFAPLNPDYTSGELKHILNLSKPKVIFVTNKTIDKIFNILPQHPYIQRVIYIGREKIQRKHVDCFEDIVCGFDTEGIDDSFEATICDPKETVATILCSSGTTGMPKGVMCTHDNMTTYIDIARTQFSTIMDRDDPKDPMIGIVPFFHSMGFMTMFLNILRGKTMIVIKKFQPKVFLDAIVNYKVSTLAVPPPVLMFLIKNPLVHEYDLSCLKEVRSGAAPLGKDTELQLRARFKISHVSQAYGMTETTLGVLINPPDKPKMGSVGKVVPGMYAKIIDEKGNALGPNQEGELCVKGPLIMKGYVGDPQATANTIDKDNWLHTGDAAYYDSEGYFYIVDRLKELIKYKAYQVAPAELEKLLVTHSAVQDAAVIGLPDEDAGELPLAYVVKKPGENVTEHELQQFVAANVSSQKQLRGGVIFVNSIPRNPTGKILRRVLKEEAKKNKFIKSKL